jgi:hypothetical protein
MNSVQRSLLNWTGATAALGHARVASFRSTIQIRRHTTTHHQLGSRRSPRGVLRRLDSQDSVDASLREVVVGPFGVWRDSCREGQCLETTRWTGKQFEFVTPLNNFTVLKATPLDDRGVLLVFIRNR